MATYNPPDPDTQEFGVVAPADAYVVPHSRENEEGTLGGILINGEIISEVFDILKADGQDFYIWKHRQIYASMCRLFLAGIPIDLLTVCTDLEEQGVLDEIGGAAYLTTLVGRVQSSLNVLDYAAKVEAYSIRRAWIEQANTIAQIAYDVGTDIDTATKRVENVVEERPAVAKTTNVSAVEAARRFKEQVHSGKPRSVSTGLKMCDQEYSGLPLKKLTMVIGDNSIGKTGLYLQTCEILNFNKERSLYITTEEAVEDMVSRRVFGNTGIDYGKFSKGELTDVEIAVLDNAVDEYIQNHAYITFNEEARNLRAIRRAVKQARPRLVIVDDLWHIFIGEGGRDNEASGLMRIATELKNIAIDEDCAVVVLHHLTVEQANKLWPGGQKPSTNEVPSLDSITWSKNLRFTVDLWLTLLPDVKTDISKDVIKIAHWVMKNKRGRRLGTLIELYYDKVQQWFYDNDSKKDMPHPVGWSALDGEKPRVITPTVTPDDVD